ncbi:MAG: ribonuclease P protein component [Cyanobacteriota bacterium]|nr:ribonuclease P protein component [Cyanobacteriota bacterium]
MALPRCHRLKGRRIFDKLYRCGRRHHGPSLVLRHLEAIPALLPPDQVRHPPSPWRCGVVVSSKVHKHAVQRNRLRRLVHNHLLRELRDCRHPQGHWLLISFKPGSCERSPSDLLGECSQLFRQAGLQA